MFGSRSKLGRFELRRAARVPKKSERNFGELCSDAGALCHNVEEDESGWDHLVEFPPLPYEGPAEAQPPGKTAYVQIKSTSGSQPRTKVTLSNARKAAQHPSPWFIVLYHHPPGDQLRIYAVHVWQELIHDSLKAVRQAEADGVKLNKRTLPIVFGDNDDHTEDLIDWMEKVIDSVGSSYSTLKQEFYKTTGFEQGYGIGQFTIEADTEEEIALGFLGLGGGLRVKNTSFAHQRFGILSPGFEMLGNGILRVTPKVASTCQIRLANSLRTERIILKGEIYSNGLARFDSKLGRIICKSEEIQLIWGLGRPIQFKFSLNTDQPVALETIASFSRVRVWLQDGPVDVQVWKDSRRLLAAEFPQTNADPTFRWERLSSLATFLRSLAGESRLVTMRDILAQQQELGRLHDIATASDVRLAFEALTHAPPPAQFLICYDVVDVGSLTFFVVIERDVIEDRPQGARRDIKLGAPRILEGYALHNPSEEDRKQIHADYSRALDRTPGNVIGIGNIGLSWLGPVDIPVDFRSASLEAT